MGENFELARLYYSVSFSRSVHATERPCTVEEAGRVFDALTYAQKSAINDGLKAAVNALSADPELWAEYRK